MRSQRLLVVSSCVALLGLGATGAAFAQEARDDRRGNGPVEKYPGFADGNPDLVDDRGNGLKAEGPAKTEEALGTAGITRYPEPIVEGNPDLSTDVPDVAPPPTGQADVHGDFGEDNPDVQR